MTHSESTPRVVATSASQSPDAVTQIRVASRGW